MLNDVAPKHWRIAARAILLTLLSQVVVPAGALAQDNNSEPQTQTPIKHVIVIIGENRSFDHVYATYQPVSGDTISNLLSKGIVNADGSKGPNYNLAAQYRAVDRTQFSISPPGKEVYTNIPAVLTGGAPTVPATLIRHLSRHCGCGMGRTEFARQDYFQYLLTGATGIAARRLRLSPGKQWTVGTRCLSAHSQHRLR